MTTQYWLAKSEPEAYAWSQLVDDGRAVWDGVRNFQARNNLKAMQRGDRVLFYASGGPKEIVGVAEVTRPAFPDPTAEGEKGAWVAVELKPVKALKRPVTLAELKADKAVVDLPLLRHSRLSVMPVSPKTFAHILKLGGA
ncbi:MAG TPA: EVE domain-containing protein [Opitutaceae bacterium]